MSLASSDPRILVAHAFEVLAAAQDAVTNLGDSPLLPPCVREAAAEIVTKTRGEAARAVEALRNALPYQSDLEVRAYRQRVELEAPPEADTPLREWAAKWRAEAAQPEQSRGAA